MTRADKATRRALIAAAAERMMAETIADRHGEDIRGVVEPDDASLPPPVDGVVPESAAGEPTKWDYDMGGPPSDFPDEVALARDVHDVDGLEIEVEP